MLAAPASAHIERGINCHMNSATQSGHFVHVSLRITNRTTHTERLGCQVKLVSDTHYRKDWSIRTISGRHYRTVRYTVRLGGTFQRWVITHGHVF
jgi:hypothetical protein